MKLSRESAEQVRTLNGSDLYRLNCRGCHGESGTGALPEINSIIDPVRATSATLVLRRMKDAGVDMSQAQAAELARQAQTALRQRIHTGGQDMPGFHHLSEAEIRLLVAHLRKLAGIPGAENDQRALPEPSARIGEHIVKSLCHICHSASGTNPTAEQLEDGSIPPLATLTARTNLAEFVRKVTNGAPIVMGNPPTAHGGRMPVFDYLSQNEVADVYLYLMIYPPVQSETGDMVRTSLLTSPTLSAPDPGDRSDPRVPRHSTTNNFDSSETGVFAPTLLLAGAMTLTSVLLVGFLGLTIREFLRVSEEIKRVSQSAHDVRPMDEGLENHAA